MEIRNEMQDFMIHVPTQIFFGRSAIDHLAESIGSGVPRSACCLSTAVEASSGWGCIRRS